MRRAYLTREKEAHGRTVMAVLPIAYPKEILTAMNILAVEVWGPPGLPASEEASRIQAYVCPVVRNAMAFLAPGVPGIDGVLFPHTCDSIQGLATVLPDLAGFPLPVANFVHPKGERRKSNETYLKQEFADLAAQLARITGKPLDPEALKGAIALHREIDRLRTSLMARRAFSPLPDREFWGVLRLGEYLWPEDYLGKLKELESGLASQAVQTGVPVMVTGIVPEPMGIYEAINAAGAFVAACDYAAIGRRVADPSAGTAPDPFDALVSRYFALPPCPTRTSLMGPRMDYLERLYAANRCRGLIVHTVKFCEPELFDLPHIRQRFARINAPVLTMEGELEPVLSGQATTRIEAFVEMTTSKRSNP